MERSSAAGNCLWVKLLRTNEKRYPVTFQRKEVQGTVEVVWCQCSLNLLLF